MTGARQWFTQPGTGFYALLRDLPRIIRNVDTMVYHAITFHPFYRLHLYTRGAKKIITLNFNRHKEKNVKNVNEKIFK